MLAWDNARLRLPCALSPCCVPSVVLDGGAAHARGGDTCPYPGAPAEAVALEAGRSQGSPRWLPGQQCPHLNFQVPMAHVPRQGGWEFCRCTAQEGRRRQRHRGVPLLQRLPRTEEKPWLGRGAGGQVTPDNTGSQLPHVTGTPEASQDQAPSRLPHQIPALSLTPDECRVHSCWATE